MNKERLINYLSRNGKTHSWEELANRFDIRSGEAARSAWKNHRRINAVPSMDIDRVQVAEVANYITELEDRVVRFEEDFKNNKAELTAETSKEVRSLDDLIKVCKIDVAKWDVTKYTQSAMNGKFSIKAWLEAKKGIDKVTTDFEEFLKNYQPAAITISKPNAKFGNSEACLVINKQDSHLNKLDINGDNSIEDRFHEIYAATDNILRKASLTSDLKEIIYVLGSDQFNSEHSDMTTKGTPQKNLMGFHDGFEAICDHEIIMINKLLEVSQHVTVAFLAGNHDEFVGWHMVKWLEAYFRNEKRITFETGSEYRKYAKFSNSAFMFNHGDAIKPEKLAGLFPMEYKEEWSECDHYYIFTGDKHNTLAKDINGIQFYQIPALSKAKSSWDDKNGYTVSKPEMTAFLITEDNGLSDVYKEFLG